MQSLIIDNLSLIILLPLWIFLIIMVGRFFSVYVNKKIIYILTLLSSFLGIVGSAFSLKYLKEGLEYSVPFIQINNFAINWGINIDKLSLILLLILYIISFFVQIFSISYMKNEKKNYRFFALLNLFNFSLSSLFVSPNLFQMYVFWELSGIVSYLLIGFEYQKEIKSNASKRVFLINRFGDTALIAGIIFTSYFMYNYAGNLRFVTLAFDDMNAISTILAGYTEPSWYIGICLLFIIASMVKSAQFPFQTWLCDAMEAKLPVSALLHSATIVASGLYLIIRLLPFFTLEEYLMQIIAFVGVGTFIICSIFGALETNHKKILAYSTSANFGIMFFLCGLENTLLALVYFCIHALVKASLFILLPQNNEKISVIHKILFTLNALTLSGFIFSGFAGKEIIYSNIGGIFKILFLIGTFITGYYLFRLVCFVILNDESKSENDCKEHLFSATSLFILNFVFYLFIKMHFSYKIGLPFIFAVLGSVFAYFVYRRNFSEKIILPSNIAEKLIISLYSKISLISETIEQKVFYNYKPLLNTAKCIVNTSSKIEEGVMNGSVRVVSNTLKQFSSWYKTLQSGNIQTYNTYALIFITIIVTLIIISYKLIFNQMS